MKVALVLLCLFVGTFAQPQLDQQEYELEFTKWMVEQSKSYEPEEMFRRFNIWRNNLDFIRQHNAGNHSYTLGTNAFTDLTTSEWAAMLGGGGPDAGSDIPAVHDDKVNANVSSSLDWVAKGAVTPVKSQGHCGTCWSFSSTGGIEGAYAILNGKLMSFSEQMLIDCISGMTCNSGGEINHAFDYAHQNGLCLEADYKYTGADESCQASKCTKKTAVRSYTRFEGESTFLNNLATGPLSISIGTSDKFHHYSSGVFSDSGCATHGHDVLIVGYGTSSDGQQYWKIKNSWGSSWGEKGYVRLRRGTKECGVGHKGFLPKV